VQILLRLLFILLYAREYNNIMREYRNNWPPQKTRACYGYHHHRHRHRHLHRHHRYYIIINIVLDILIYPQHAIHASSSLVVSVLIILLRFCIISYLHVCICANRPVSILLRGYNIIIIIIIIVIIIIIIISYRGEWREFVRRASPSWCTSPDVTIIYYTLHTNDDDNYTAATGML